MRRATILNDYINDCMVSFVYENEIIIEGQTFTLTQGDSELLANVTCEEDACPQQINIEVTLNG